MFLSHKSCQNIFAQCDQHLSHMLVGYVEKEEMRKVTNQAVVDRFMKMTE
jgi:hypothetical protein